MFLSMVSEMVCDILSGVTKIGMGCFVLGVKSGMGCFVRGGRNDMGCFGYRLH